MLFRSSQAEAAVKSYTQINFFSNLFGESNDPCNKMGVAINGGGLFTEQFQQQAQSANDSLKVAVSGLGGKLTR